jgi:hypothetical protein
MSVKKFKFVSPGVFINEIDNSYIPRSADSIGPCVVGRSTRGLAMTPITVQSYSDFVQMFGDTVPGGSGDDVYRNGNYKSPMYGTYAAKAFLRSNVAPLTYVRLLGQQLRSGLTGDAGAGWKTAVTKGGSLTEDGGAFGIWLFESGSVPNMGTGSLAAVIYVDTGSVMLRGNIRGDIGGVTSSQGGVTGKDTDGLYTIEFQSDAESPYERIRFNFDDSSDNFIRKKLNTNPQLATAGGDFFPVSTVKDYWLGETYEQEISDASFSATQAVILPILSASSTTTTPADMSSQASREARTGWIISQDLTTPATYVPFNMQKLFRFVGRGHGEWLNKNAKVSIANVRPSNNSTTDYGSFSVIIRNLHDSDNAVVVLERFDMCSLDPSSPNYIARKIGDKYQTWSETERRLKTYGEYDNQSKFIYVKMDTDVDAGATDATYLPFGYFGPPQFMTAEAITFTGSTDSTGRCPVPNMLGGIYQDTTQLFVSGGADWLHGNGAVGAGGLFMSGCNLLEPGTGAPDSSKTYCSAVSLFSGSVTGSLKFPVVRIRNSASDGGISDPRDAYFGFQTTRSPSTNRGDSSIGDFNRMLYTGFTGGGGDGGAQGVLDSDYVFSLDDLVNKSATDEFYYSSGSRAGERSYTSGSYRDILDAGYGNFTMPLRGGFDGWNIFKPDPAANVNIGSTAESSYVNHTIKRAIDSVGDPEVLNMNLLTMPGLTNTGLTEHMITTCEDRGDAMSLIDLPNVYIPAAEGYKSSKDKRIGTTAQSAAKDLRDRRIDSSYGATFYPWVQTRDSATGQALWVPPTVAMMGVLASSEAKSALWFAPAGFNRGGLSEGAAGIPVTGITQRLTSKERDQLYEASINPIASFPSTGIVVFGQKTLQERQSALDRINVRRLVIYLKKQISIISSRILFEQNVPATWNRFTSLVEPFLANVKVAYGITDYKLILDEATTTPDLIDQNIMYAKIMIKPARAIEYIAIDFVVASTGASFDD